MYSELTPFRLVGRRAVIASAGAVAVASATLVALNVPAAQAAAPSAAAVSVVAVHADEGSVNHPERIIASVTNSAGDPIDGAKVTFTVTGRNPGHGSETTTSKGRVAFVYQADNVGRDHVTATSGGVSGRTTALIAHGDSTPTVYAKSPSAGVVDLGVRSRADFAGREVAIYILGAGGARNRVANLTLRSDGTGSYRFTGQRSGRTLIFEARVVPVAHDDYRQYFSSTEPVTVR